jgi:acyl carrier protein
MKRTELYENIEGILELEAGTIKGNEKLDSLGEWNSLSIISFIAFADGMLGLSLNPDALKNAKTVADLAAMVNEKIDS